MSVKILFAIMSTFLLMMPLVSADYTCVPATVTITINSADSYSVNTPFNFMVTVTNFPSSGVLSGQITGNNVAPKNIIGTKISDTQWKFSVDSITTGGVYTITISGVNTITNKLESANKNVAITSALGVKLWTDESIQYTTNDLILHAQISPIGCSVASWTLTAEKRSYLGVYTPVSINALPINPVGDMCDFKITKEQFQLLQPSGDGYYNFILQASDPNNQYYQNSYKFSDVQISKPQISASITVPSGDQDCKAGVSITINTLGVKSVPVEVDSISLLIHPSSGNDITITTFTHIVGTAGYNHIYTSNLGQIVYLTANVFADTKGYSSAQVTSSITCKSGPTVEICNNGVDDNGNGLIDCADPQCTGSQYCGGPVCTSGIDVFGLCLGILPVAVIAIIVLVAIILVVRKLLK